mgnify:CR=1 FL=1
MKRLRFENGPVDEIDRRLLEALYDELIALGEISE